MTTLPKVLPCPWCHNPTIHLNGGWVPGKHLCVCRGCHACGPAEPTKTEAIKAWNSVAQWGTHANDGIPIGTEAP